MSMCNFTRFVFIHVSKRCIVLVGTTISVEQSVKKDSDFWLPAWFTENFPRWCGCARSRSGTKGVNRWECYILIPNLLININSPHIGQVTNRCNTKPGFLGGEPATSRKHSNNPQTTNFDSPLLSLVPSNKQCSFMKLVKKTWWSPLV
jgi:hypothetical protein